MRAAVLADMGLAIASEWMFSPELADGTVQAVLTDWELPTIDVWAVFPAGRMVSEGARVRRVCRGTAGHSIRQRRG